MTSAMPPLSDLPVNLWPVGQVSAQRQRQGRYVDASGRHPGKMLPELARRLVRAYTRLGDWILDPLSGTGTTGVEAVHLGRNYVGIERVPRFVRWQQANLALAREQGASGRAEVIEGDARRLAEGEEYDSALPAGPVDAVLTSPPYGPWLGARYPGRRFWEDPLSAADRESAAAETDLRDLARVFRGCAEVLKPGGILAAVVRPGRAGYRLRPFHHEVARLCQAAGLEWLDEIIALLARVETGPGGEVALFHHAHYFRRSAVARLRAAGYPLSLEQVEYVLVFRKPDAPPVQRLLLPRPRKSGLSAALTGPELPRERRAEVPVIRHPA